MNAPLITVCIPAYRAEAYLETTLRSVAEQTFTRWSIIVTEDGSKDRAEEIVRAFAAQVAQPVLYNRHEHNRGLPATRNTGIAAAQSEWVAFLDSDDLWKPAHLESLVAAAEKDNPDLVFAGTIPFDHDSGAPFPAVVPTSVDLDRLPLALYTGTLSILPSAVMVRRDAFARFGLISTAFPCVNDTEYWLRILRRGGRAAYSGSATCLYRKHAGAMSTRSVEMLHDSARLCEHYADWTAIPSDVRRSRPASLYRWAGVTLLNDRPREALVMVKQALRLQPLNFKSLGLYGKALLRQCSAPRPSKA